MVTILDFLLFLSSAVSYKIAMDAHNLVSYHPASYKKEQHQLLADFYKNLFTKFAMESAKTGEFEIGVIVRSMVPGARRTSIFLKKEVNSVCLAKAFQINEPGFIMASARKGKIREVIKEVTYSMMLDRSADGKITFLAFPYQVTHVLPVPRVPGDEFIYENAFRQHVPETFKIVRKFTPKVHGRIKLLSEKKPFKKPVCYHPSLFRKETQRWVELWHQMVLVCMRVANVKTYLDPKFTDAMQKHFFPNFSLKLQEISAVYLLIPKEQNSLEAFLEIERYQKIVMAHFDEDREGRLVAFRKMCVISSQRIFRLCAFFGAPAPIQPSDAIRLNDDEFLLVDKKKTDKIERVEKIDNQSTFNHFLFRVFSGTRMHKSPSILTSVFKFDGQGTVLTINVSTRSFLNEKNIIMLVLPDDSSKPIPITINLPSFTIHQFACKEGDRYTQATELFHFAHPNFRD